MLTPNLDEAKEIALDTIVQFGDKTNPTSNSDPENPVSGSCVYQKEDPFPFENKRCIGGQWFFACDRPVPGPNAPVIDDLIHPATDGLPGEVVKFLAQLQSVADDTSGLSWKEAGLDTFIANYPYSEENQDDQD